MPYVYTPSSATISGPSPQWNWNWATLKGPDAQDFLHRVTSAGVRGLEVGHGTHGCFLTPQGKLRAYFHLWRYGPSEFGIEFDGGENGRWRDSLFASIDQYTFAEKMTLTQVSGLECRWIFDFDLSVAPHETRALPDESKDDEIRICHEGTLDFGRPWVTVWGRPARLSQWLDRLNAKFENVSAETLDAWRIHALRPRLDRELTENTGPLEAGLVDAIAPNKGCYPGQEVIEKIISLGSPAKRLALIEGQGAMPQAPTSLLNVADPAAEVGQITSAAPTVEGVWSALAFVRKNYSKEGLEVQASENKSRGVIRKISPYA